MATTENKLTFLIHRMGSVIYGYAKAEDPDLVLVKFHQNTAEAFGVDCGDFVMKVLTYPV